MATASLRSESVRADAAVEFHRSLALVAVAPPPKLLVSEWAERAIVLEKGTTPEPGEWRNDRAPYQRGMMDAICDPGVEDVVFMTSAQIGKTSIILNTIGYFMDQDPCPILAVLPTVEMGEVWSKDRLAPMVRLSPALREKVRAAKSRDADNTILHKKFPGGTLSVVGANAPSSLAMRPVRVVLADDIDRFPPSAGTEGDPIALAEKRTENFWNRKKIKNSTPTVKGVSRIEQAWMESDQRRYYVPCPLCGHFQHLKWNPADGKGGVVFSRDENGRAIDGTARYECEECKGHIEEFEKREMLAKGEWRATYPERKVVGFHINAIYSPWRSWDELVEEWDASRKNPERLKVFVNTVLGETWEEAGEGVEPAALKTRIERYKAEVPKGVGAMVASVDVQSDRLECVVKGYGVGEESWLIEHAVIEGDPGDPGVWGKLDTFLRSGWKHESGQRIPIDVATIDSGGLHTEQVYRFTAAREGGITPYGFSAGERPVLVFAIKGAAGPREIVGRSSRSERYKVKLYVVGVDTAKDIVFSRLRVRVTGPGYMHLNEKADDEYLDQLTGERAVWRWRKGKGRVREWEKVRERNEALDLEVYALAALRIGGAALAKAIPVRAERFAVVVEEKKEEPRVPRPGRPRRSGWVNRWR